MICLGNFNEVGPSYNSEFTESGIYAINMTLRQFAGLHRKGYGIGERTLGFGVVILSEGC